MAKEKSIEEQAAQEVKKAIKRGSRATKHTRSQIRTDLLNQLEENGTYGKQYEDLVEDYMRLWDTKNELFKNIKENGVSVKWQNSEASFGYKKNDSISEAVRVSAQMLKILHTLKLTPGNKVGDDDGDFEDM